MTVFARFVALVLGRDRDLVVLRRREHALRTLRGGTR